MENVGDFLKVLFQDFVWQMALTVGVIFLFGLLIALCRRSVARLLGRAGYVLQLVTGFIGTPVHELGHAAMCLIFFHRIEEIKLYDPKSNDGSLGHVNHSYNSRNLYQRIGNFFIGIAPIIVGTAVLFLLMYWLVPDVYAVCNASLEASGGTFSFGVLFNNFSTLLRALFLPANFGQWKWWVFMLVALSIASHMELSGADIKGSLDGLFFVSLTLLVIDAIILLGDAPTMNKFNDGILGISLGMCSFLMIAVVLSLLTLLIALVIVLIRRLIKH